MTLNSNKDRKVLYLLLSTISGAIIFSFIVWGFSVLFFPSMSIDIAFNMIAAFFAIGGIAGFLFYLKNGRRD